MQIKMTNRKTIATPKNSWVTPSEKNREGVQKLQARALKIEQMKLDIQNMTVDLLGEGLSHEDAKAKAESTFDPTNILKPFLKK